MLYNTGKSRNSVSSVFSNSPFLWLWLRLGLLWDLRSQSYYILMFDNSFMSHVSSSTCYCWTVVCFRLKVNQYNKFQVVMQAEIPADETTRSAALTAEERRQRRIAKIMANADNRMDRILSVGGLSGFSFLFSNFCFGFTDCIGYPRRVLEYVPYTSLYRRKAISSRDGRRRSVQGGLALIVAHFCVYWIGAQISPGIS